MPHPTRSALQVPLSVAPSVRPSQDISVAEPERWQCRLRLGSPLHTFLGEEEGEKVTDILTQFCPLIVRVADGFPEGLAPSLSQTGAA